MDSYGDPGLLISDALDENIEKQEYIGIVPHHSQVSSPKITQLIERDPRLKLIDVRFNNANQVVREIASCRYVLSSSLHGLIVADSYGIPNTWLHPTQIHKTPKFKFYDYALSVHRDLPQPVRLEEVSRFVDDLRHCEITYHEGILASKRALVDIFPPELKVELQN